MSDTSRGDAERTAKAALHGRTSHPSEPSEKMLRSEDGKSKLVKDIWELVDTELPPTADSSVDSLLFAALDRLAKGLSAVLRSHRRPDEAPQPTAAHDGGDGEATPDVTLGGSVASRESALARTAFSIVKKALQKSDAQLDRVAERQMNTLTEEERQAVIEHFAGAIVAGVREHLADGADGTPLAVCIRRCDALRDSRRRATVLGRTVVGTPETIPQLTSRYIHIGDASSDAVAVNRDAMKEIDVNPLPPAAPDGAPATVSESRFKALVLCGSSGSGKTGTAVAFGECDVTVYLLPSEDWREPATSATVGNLPLAKDKERRDEAARAFIVNQVTEALDGVCDAIEGKGGPPPYYAGTLRVVLDECGGAPTLLRGCISSHTSILSALLGLSREGRHSFSAVQLVYAGTGAEDEERPAAGFGSSDTLYDVVNMDDTKRANTFPTYWTALLEQGDPSLSAAWRLIAADRSSAAMVVRELLTNPRAGALIVLWMRDNGWTKKRFDVAELEPQLSGRVLAGVLASDVISRFMNMNGLQNVSRAERVRMLTYALAVDMGAYEQIDASLKPLLLVRYGVLSDRARPTKHSATAPLAPVCQTSVGARGRYEVPRAYRAMWRWEATGGECLVSSGALRWMELESHAAGWAVALCASVTPERSLVDLVALTERQAKGAADSLPTQPATEDTFCGTCRLPWDGSAQNLHRVDKNNRTESMIAPGPVPQLAEVVHCADGVPLSAGNPGSEARDGGLPVVLNVADSPPRVLVNAPAAPGADILVACRSIASDGTVRREVVLIQAKARDKQPGVKEWAKELAKLGMPYTTAIDGVPDKYATQRELVRRLSEQRVAVACVAIVWAPRGCAVASEAPVKLLEKLSEAAGLLCGQGSWTRQSVEVTSSGFTVNDDAKTPRDFSVHSLLQLHDGTGVVDETQRDVLFPITVTSIPAADAKSIPAGTTTWSVPEAAGNATTAMPTAGSTPATVHRPVKKPANSTRKASKRPK